MINSFEVLPKVENSDYLEKTDVDDLNREIYSFINLCMESVNNIPQLPSLNGAPQFENNEQEMPLNGRKPPGLEAVDESMQFLRASFLGNCFAIRRFLDKGVDRHYCDKVGRNALHYAVAGGRESAVKMLIDSGIKIDIPDCKKWTPLLIAINKNFAKEVKILLEAGADIHAQLEHHLFPCRSVAAVSEAIHFSAIQKNREITEMLLQYGSDINCTDTSMRTPLHYASCRSNSEYVQWLIEKGANLNATDIHKRTPIHSSCLNGNWVNTQILLSKGCSPLTKDIWDLTAYNLLHIRGYKEMKKQMDEYLIKENIQLSPQVTSMEPLEETVYNILQTGLKERNTSQLQRAVKKLGSLTCLELYQKTMTLEQNGGTMTNDGQRRKTPGGVFYTFLKEKIKNNEIPLEHWRYISQEEKEKHLIYKNKRNKNITNNKIDKIIKSQTTHTAAITTDKLVPTIERINIPNKQLNNTHNMAISYEHFQSLPILNISPIHMLPSLNRPNPPAPPPPPPTTTRHKNSNFKKRQTRTKIQ